MKNKDTVYQELLLFGVHQVMVQRLRDAIQKGLDSDTITGEEYRDRFALKRAAMLKDKGMSAES